MQTRSPRSKRKTAGSGQAKAESTALLRSTLLECAHGAGRILRGYFGRVSNPRLKESHVSVVCDADLAAEAYVVKLIRRRFPHHRIVAEESGLTAGDSEYTWVIDPLDGTSNFVAGIPWFGTQLALLRGTQPILAAMYLPIQDSFYFAERGRPARKNDQVTRVTRERTLQHTLCAFGFDPTGDARRRRARAELLVRVSGAVRNIRATNSLVDFCYTADGRLGGCLTLNAKIWDIAPVSLILPQAGGRLTDLRGAPLAFDLGPQACTAVYQVLGSSRRLHPELVALARRSSLL